MVSKPKKTVAQTWNPTPGSEGGYTTWKDGQGFRSDSEGGPYTGVVKNTTYRDGIAVAGPAIDGTYASQPAATPSWVDGTSTPGQATINRRAPIIPIPGAVLLQAPEDEASLETKRERPIGGGSNRPVIDRTTGRVREEEDDELRRNGAILLR